jgi:acyl-CoA synthetase (AMP-forming)/AMP-acid ligase II/pyrroloquinoline quinone (PQQ) biosynthesis protein C
MSGILCDAIARHAALRPDARSIDGGAEHLSYSELAEALPQVTRQLRARFGAASSPPVGLAVDNSLAACLLDLGFAQAGIPIVQLPPFFTDAQVQAALQAAGCQALITGAGLDDLASDAPLCLEVAEVAAHPRILPAGTGKISFSSGSTGTPKGVCLSISHLSQVAQAVVDSLGTEHAGRHLPLLPPGILLETVAGFYATLLAGGTYVARSQAGTGLADPFRPDIVRTLQAIVEADITSLILVPEYLAGLVRGMEQTGVRLPKLTLVAVGGARIAPALLARAAALGLPVRQGYGLTECGSVVSLERGDEPGLGSVGRSLGAHRISLADDGEILIEGPLHLGTLGLSNPEGALHTGDIGHFDETGRLWVDGRKSALIVTSFGRNISPEWIETLLVAEPEIAQAMVRGDGKPTLDALLVPATSDAAVGDAVARVNAALPAYAQIAGFRLVPPFTPANGMLTGNGRIRRAAIAAAYPERTDNMPFFNRLVEETRDAQARFVMTPQLIAGLTGRISRSDYIAYLGQAYHHVRHTVPLMQEARARLGHNETLRAALDDYIEEETGHEHWILDDITAAGGDAAAIAASDPAPATKAMVEHAYSVIREGNPAAFFGMVFVLEGTSIAMASNGAAAVQQSLGLPPEAFRYLTSHGALDQDHMKFFERLMNRIEDPADQQAIIAMARDMFGLFGGVFASIELEASREAA